MNKSFERIFVFIFVPLALLFDAFIVASRSGPVSCKGDSSIEAFCAREWPDDYEMQAYCVGDHTGAVRALSDWVSRYTPNFHNKVEVEKELQRGHRATWILARCASEWEDRCGAYDYPMVWYCVQKQSKAVEKLGKKVDGYEYEEKKRENKSNEQPPGEPD